MVFVKTYINDKTADLLDKACTDKGCSRYKFLRELLEDRFFNHVDHGKGQTQEERVQTALQTADRELHKLEKEKTKTAQDFSDGDEPSGDMVEDLSPNSEVGRPPEEPNSKNQTPSTDSKSKEKNSPKKSWILNIYA